MHVGMQSFIFSIRKKMMRLKGLNMCDFNRHRNAYKAMYCKQLVIGNHVAIQT